MLIAGVGKLYYAASLEQSGAIVARGKTPPIDELRRESALPPDGRRMPSEQRRAAEAVVVLEAWAKKYQ
jgi:hypothetical protein